MTDEFHAEQSSETHIHTEPIFFDCNEILNADLKILDGRGGEVIYANPNQGTFRIKVPDAFLHRSGLQLKVIDSAGRIVHDQTLNLQGESPRMDLFDVSPGYYLVTLGNSERTYSGHMVVE